jgi:hypothetical protein
MGGNVYQWNEALFSLFDRGIRGGSFDYSASGDVLSSSRYGVDASSDFFGVIGFRLVNIPSGYVPEPSSLVLAALGFIGIAWRLRRR